MAAPVEDREPPPPYPMQLPQHNSTSQEGARRRLRRLLSRPRSRSDTGGGSDDPAETAGEERERRRRRKAQAPRQDWTACAIVALSMAIIVFTLRPTGATPAPTRYEQFIQQLATTAQPTQAWPEAVPIPHQQMLQYLQNWRSPTTPWGGLPTFKDTPEHEKEERKQEFERQHGQAATQLRTLNVPPSLRLQPTGTDRPKSPTRRQHKKHPRTRRSTAVAKQDRLLQAYDCSEPWNITTVSLRGEIDQLKCDQRSLRKKQEKKTYLLLQETERVSTKVRYCRGRYARIVYICATQSHVELVPNEFRFDYVYHFDQPTCADMWEHQGYEFPYYQEIGGRKSMWQHTKRNKVSHLVLPRVGKYWSSVNGIECEGGRINKWDLKHIWYGAPADYLDSAIMVDLLNLEMFEEDAYVLTSRANPSEKRLHVPSKNLILSCDYKQGHCDAGLDGTFIWKPMADEDPNMCPFFKLKPVSGVQLRSPSPAAELDREGLLEMANRDRRGATLKEEDEDAEMFIATNGTMLRVRRIGQPISRCNGVVYATEYPQIYLTEDFEHKQFNRPISAKEVNFAMISMMGDHYVHGQLQDDLERSLLSLQIEQCEQRRERAKRSYAQKLARQKAVADGDTAHVGDGIFITASGDAAHIYHCRPIVVRAVVKEDGQCYSALPVELTEGKDKEFLQRLAQEQGTIHVGVQGFNVTINDTEIRLFLEPRTHRLVMMAVPVECIPQMVQQYETLTGDWIAHFGNSIHVANTPIDPKTQIDTGFWNYVRSKLPSPIDSLPYEWETLLSFCRFLQDPTAAQSLALEMTRGIKTVVSHTGEKVQDVFHRMDMGGFVSNLASNSFASTIMKLSGLMDAYNTWGSFIKHAFILYISVLCMLYFMRVVGRLCSDPEGKGYLGHVFYALDPDLYRFICLRKFKRDGPHGPSQALVEAVAALMQERGFRLDGYAQQCNHNGGSSSEDDNDDNGGNAGATTRGNSRSTRRRFKKQRSNVRPGPPGSLRRTNSTTTCATELEGAAPTANSTRMNLLEEEETPAGAAQAPAADGQRNVPTPLEIVALNSQEMLPMPSYPFVEKKPGANVVKMPPAQFHATVKRQPSLRLQQQRSEPGPDAAAALASEDQERFTTPPPPPLPETRAPPNSVILNRNA